MSEHNARKLAALDRRYVWHPFTQMRDWLKREPVVIVEGRGAVLRDARGRRYLDANSSIWTNLHGHSHPKINAAVQRQLSKIAHSSALGLANEPASLLAEKLIRTANSGTDPAGRQPRALAKVFFSDDGSTAMEVALKLAFEWARRAGRSRKPKFISLGAAYHGDTVGAMALGHSPQFHSTYSSLLFRTHEVMTPYCYRCPFNRARPERADARLYRKCDWECVGKVEQKFSLQKRRGEPYAAFVFEPLLQGAAGMIAQPSGWLRQATEIARAHGALLIADEVMTGFGRTGLAASRRTRETISENRQRRPPHLLPALPSHSPGLFACHQEGVEPGLMALAKGLTGGWLPMGATLTTQSVFDAFLGEYAEFKTFFHGHSFTGNQLGAAAALASMDILQSPASIRARTRLERALREELQSLWPLPSVGDIRQVGLVAGVELVKNWRSRQAFDLREKAGMHVCEAMARRGVLTRPIGNVIVLMPPYCTTESQAAQMVAALRDAIAQVLGPEERVGGRVSR